MQKYMPIQKINKVEDSYFGNNCLLLCRNIWYNVLHKVDDRSGHNKIKKC